MGHVYTTLSLPNIVISLHGKPRGKVWGLQSQRNFSRPCRALWAIFVEDASYHARNHADMPSQLTAGDAKSLQFFLQNASGYTTSSLIILIVKVVRVFIFKRFSLSLRVNQRFSSFVCFRRRCGSAVPVS